MQKIIYDGIKHISGQYYLFLANDLGNVIQIPLDEKMAMHIKLYVGKLCPGISDPVERGNEEGL